VAQSSERGRPHPYVYLEGMVLKRSWGGGGRFSFFGSRL